MAQDAVAQKAKLLLVRRAAPRGPWFYVARDWRRHLLFLIAYIAIPIAFWLLNLPMLAFAAACFFAGSKIRDVRWWVALAREWPVTVELIDWQKVEHFAGSEGDQRS